MQKYKTKFIQLTLWLTFLTTFVSGQQKPTIEEDVIRVETRVVAVNVLVRDKKTRQPVTDLRREDFKLKVDGKTREIEQFGLDGIEDCPLTLILYFNLAPNGALRYLEQPKARKSLSESLAELGETDEVAIITAPDWFVGEPKVLVKPTRDWKAVSKIVGETLSQTVSSDKKTDKSNNRTMSEAIAEVEKIAAEKPEREIALVYISDGINTLDTMKFDERKALAARLLKSEISFSALNFDMLSGYSVAANIINPLSFAFGASVTGSANYFAEQTGGIAVKVDKAEDFGASLEQIINLYGSRYGLSFTLDESETDDGKLHKLEITINENSVNENKRKLLISARRGYYVARSSGRN